MCDWEPVGILRTIPWGVLIARSDVLAHGEHAFTGIESSAVAIAGIGDELRATIELIHAFTGLSRWFTYGYDPRRCTCCSYGAYELVV